MNPIPLKLLSIFVLLMTVSAAEYVGLEKLSVLDGKIPQTRARPDLGYRKRIKYKVSVTHLPMKGDSPERKDLVKNGFKSVEMINEVIETNATVIVIRRTLSDNASVTSNVSLSRRPTTSKEYWEDTISFMHLEGRLLKAEFLSVEYLGTKRIGDFECYGQKIHLLVTIELDNRNQKRVGSILQEDWTTMALPGDGTVLSTGLSEVPDVPHKMIIEQRYLGPAD